MSTPNISRKVYYSVVEDVISNVREAFLDEGVDEQVLQELKMLWESKLSASRALDPPDPEPMHAGNIPYQLMQPQQSQRPVMQPGGAAVQHIQQLPVHINNDGQQISNAASMAFNAQSGMFAQQIQALVNVNPGAQITLQQTANGQYIIHTMPQGAVQQGVQQQMIQLPQQTIIQNQHGQLQHIQQGLPQLDGTYDEDDTHKETSSTHDDSSSTNDACCSKDTLSHVSNDGCSLEFDIDTSSVDVRKLRRDLRRSRNKGRVPQLDGNHDSSSSDSDNLDDDDDDNDEEEKEEEAEGEEEEPLNSADDVSEEDPQELFDTDNVVVCQFEKIGRNKSKWKFNLKDGIMNLDGKDHVFQKGTGEADW